MKKLAILFLVLSGCSSAVLKPGAEKITILREESPSCSLIKTISAKVESETKSLDEVQVVAEISLRNQTLSSGGDSFLITEVKDGEKRNSTGHISKTRSLSAKALSCHKK